MPKNFFMAMAIAIAMPTHADILSVPSSQTVENPDQAENPDSLTDVFMLDQIGRAHV